MKDFFKHIFTDALGRPEIKMILGVPAFLTGLIIGALSLFKLFTMDWAGWGTYMGFCLSLLITTAAADASIDKRGQ